MDQRLCVTDLKAEEPVQLAHPEWRARSVAFSTNGKMMAVAKDDEEVALADANTGEIVRTLAEVSDRVAPKSNEGFILSVEGILALAFSADGKTLASASNNKTIGLWDAIAATERRRLTGHTGPVLSLAIAPDGSTLASAGHDNTVRLWDLKAVALKQTIAEKAPINGVAFSPDSTTLASVSDDWDPHSGELKQVARQSRATQ